MVYAAAPGMVALFEPEMASGLTGECHQPARAPKVSLAAHINY